MSAAAALEQVLRAAAGDAALTVLIAERVRLQQTVASRRILRQQAARLRFEQRQAARRPNPAAWHAWFDGSAMPNPGPIGLGGVLRAPDDSYSTISRAGGSGDSNIAEYLALIAVLEHALARDPAVLVVHGDSRIVIGDVLMTTPVRVAGLEAHRRRARTLLAKFSAVRLIWIPRAKNTAADALAREVHAKKHAVNV
jgi:ribonuclease HI